VDLVATLERSLAAADFRAALQEAAAGTPVLGWTEEPLVSSDLRARPESLVIAAPELRIDGPQVRVFGWYDNEWGFSARMIDMAIRMAARS
jgi:glyceraldehyde 3-phosphate dehydrogenase